MSERNKPNYNKFSLFFGPGTIITVFVAVLIVAWQLSMPPKVHIEREIVPGSISITRKPSAEQLLNWDTQLHLSEAQRKKLQHVFAEERLALAPVNADIDIQLKKFNEFAARRKPASLTDIASYRKPLSELSQRKRAIEHTFEQQGTNLLDADQQAIAQRLYKSLVDDYRSHQ
jgi:hypothetical protein